MPFNEVFGGAVLLPSDLSYLALTIAADADLLWPLEQQVGGTNVVADIIDLNATNPGLNVDLPDARLVSPGTSVLFNNVGAQTVSVRNQSGGNIISLVSGTTWLIYLTDNSTANGTWRTFQFGASVSVANAAALAGAGLKAIATTLNARIVTAEKSATPYAVVDADRAVSLVWTGGIGTFNLDAAGTVGADWFCYIRNSGSGDLTVTPPAGTIDGSASKTYSSGASSIVVCDGANYYTLGFGSGSGGGGSGFDFITINVAGSGDFVLSGASLGKIGYRFTGVLTGTRNIIVPGSTDEYWVDNQTTGAFSLFVKTAAQIPGIEVLQNNRNILYSDGTNVIAAESATVSFPIPVAQGGTGATTASAARTNLGATATGGALFTAVDQAAAQTALGIALTATNVWTNFNTSSFSDPGWELNETDAAANNRRWSWRAVGEQMRLSVWDDARASVVDFMFVDRTLNVIDLITWTATAFNFIGLLQYGGLEVGTRIIPHNNTNPNYTIVASDSGKFFAPTGGGGNTYTIPSNAAVSFPNGTTLSFINRTGLAISIAINTDTLVLAAAGSTGTRTLANNGWAQAIKIGTNTWMISGVGLT